MPNGPSSPIHEAGVIRMREHATILLRLSLWLRLSHLLVLLYDGRLSLVQLLLLLLPPSLFFLTTLSLLTVVYQKGQCARKREDNE